MVFSLSTIRSNFRWRKYTQIIKNIYEGVYRSLRGKVLALRGYYDLKIDGVVVSFSAPTSTMVNLNMKRFTSEYEELSDFMSEIKPGDVVYDIGANTGLYSLFAASKNEDVKVVSFEPYPKNVELLRRDIRRNQLDNVQIKEIALSDTTGTVEFSQPQEEISGHGALSIEAESSQSTTKVSTNTGDKLISKDKIPNPNVIKIDVEGAEPLVIEGLRDAIKDDECRLVYCEIHLSDVEHRPSIQDFGSNYEDFCIWLNKLGFSVHELKSRDDSELFIKAEK